jgi:four helix bundle protein
MFRFEELKVYEESINLSGWVYEITNHWPKSEMFGLTDQFRRAAVSVSLNIAEGTSRSKKDFGHFLDMSRGSCYECVAIGRIVKNLKYLDPVKYADLYQQCEKLSKMISALKRAIST